jgi:uncharacterized protein DUF5658
MARLYKPWDTPNSLFGDIAVLGFVLMQCLDGIFTYLGVSIWGPGIEANPLISSAVQVAGLGTGLAGAKLMAVGFGMLLHLRRVHTIVAILTAMYFTLAILPWSYLFLSSH